MIFGPNTGRLGELARSLGSPPILAVTASAGPRTRDDIAALLFPHPPQVFLRSFARDNLALAFRERRDGLRQLADFVERHARIERNRLLQLPPQGGRARARSSRPRLRRAALSRGAGRRGALGA